MSHPPPAVFIGAKIERYYTHLYSVRRLMLSVTLTKSGTARGRQTGRKGLRDTGAGGGEAQGHLCA